MILYVGRSFINLADLTIAVEFFNGKVFGEANTAHHLHAFGSNAFGHLGRVQFGDRGFLKERLSLFSQSGSVVDEELSRLDVSSTLCMSINREDVVYLGNIKLHSLEGSNRTTKLLSFGNVRQGLLGR